MGRTHEEDRLLESELLHTALDNASLERQDSSLFCS